MPKFICLLLKLLSLLRRNRNRSWRVVGGREEPRYMHRQEYMLGGQDSVCWVLGCLLVPPGSRQWLRPDCFYSLSGVWFIRTHCPLLPYLGVLHLLFCSLTSFCHLLQLGMLIMCTSSCHQYLAFLKIFLSTLFFLVFPDRYSHSFSIHTNFNISTAVLYNNPSEDFLSLLLGYYTLEANIQHDPQGVEDQENHI